MDEQIKIELADMRIAHDRNLYRMHNPGVLIGVPMPEAIVESESP